MSWTGSHDFLERLGTRLLPLDAPGDLPDGGEIALLGKAEIARIRDAGVLIGVVDRGMPDDLNVVLTLRPDTMANHAGQVAFPGGKVDAGDKDAVAAALREAEEEVGLSPDAVKLIGRTQTYVTGTGFRITPVIGLLDPGFTARPDPYEVADVFETPLSFLMNPANHEWKETRWRGADRRYLAMSHEGRYIWGVTAGVVHALYERLYGTTGTQD